VCQRMALGIEAKQGHIYLLEDFLSLYTDDCTQTTSQECSLQRLNSCTSESTWEEQQLASTKIMPGTMLTLHKYILLSFCHY